MFNGLVKESRQSKSYFNNYEPDPYTMMGINRPAAIEGLYDVPVELRPYYIKMFKERAAKAYGSQVVPQKQRRTG